MMKKMLKINLQEMYLPPYLMFQGIETLTHDLPFMNCANQAPAIFCVNDKEL